MISGVCRLSWRFCVRACVRSCALSKHARFKRQPLTLCGPGSAASASTSRGHLPSHQPASHLFSLPPSLPPSSPPPALRLQGQMHQTAAHTHGRPCKNDGSHFIRAFHAHTQKPKSHTSSCVGGLNGRRREKTASPARSHNVARR